MNELVLRNTRDLAETAGWASAGHQTLCKRGQSPQVPHRGQRLDSLWVALLWSLVSIEPRKRGWAAGIGRGEYWPLLCRPRWRLDLPHLAPSISSSTPSAALATGLPPSLPFMRRGTFSICSRLTGAFPPGSQITFHSQKQSRSEDV